MEYPVEQVAKLCVISYAQGVLDINDERMKKPISVKLDKVPRFPDDWKCAVIVSKDVTGDIHLYVVANNHLYRKSLEKLFKVKMVGYVGHVRVDTDEKSAYYFPIVNSFSEDFLREKKVEMDKELENRFPEWKEDY